MYISAERPGQIETRARGRKRVRVFKLDEKQINQMKTLYNSKTVPIKDILSTFKISRRTLYSYVNK